MNRSTTKPSIHGSDCFVCGSSNQKKLLFQKDGYTIVKCRCEFVYVNPRYSADHASQIYDSGNWFVPVETNLDKFSRKDYSLTQHSDKLRANNVLKKIQKLIRKGKVLDIGSGLGSFLDQNNIKHHFHVFVDIIINDPTESRCQ